MTFKPVYTVLFATAILLTTSCNKTTDPDPAPSTTTTTGTGGSGSGGGGTTTPSAKLELTIDGQKITGTINLAQKQVVTSQNTNLLVGASFNWHGKKQNLTIGVNGYKGAKKYISNSASTFLHFSPVTVDTAYGSTFGGSDEINVTKDDGVTIQGTFKGILEVSLKADLLTAIDSIEVTNGTFVAKY